MQITLNDVLKNSQLIKSIDHEALQLFLDLKLDKIDWNKIKKIITYTEQESSLISKLAAAFKLTFFLIDKISTWKHCIVHGKYRYSKTDCMHYFYAYNRKGQKVLDVWYENGILMVRDKEFYDENGNNIRSEGYGPNRLPTKHSWTNRIFNKVGKPIKIEISNGYFLRGITHLKYNKNNVLIEETYFDSLFGIKRKARTTRYNDQGNLIYFKSKNRLIERFYDSNGRLTLIVDNGKEYHYNVPPVQSNEIKKIKIIIK